MCKVTGKTGLTYEEAMVSEQHATEKVQQFPKELMTTALGIIQYSKNTLFVFCYEEIYVDIMMHNFFTLCIYFFCSA